MNKPLFAAVVLPALVLLASCEPNKGNEVTEPEQPAFSVDTTARKGIGVFSVAAGKTVTFSPGNLQYTTLGTHLTADGSTQKGTWRFAEQQYDVIGAYNMLSGSDYEGWIDLFGWGTSGFDNLKNDSGALYFQPWDTIDAPFGRGYGPSPEKTDWELTDIYRYYDWGIYNAISNGGNVPGLWRSLTDKEWEYLTHDRENAHLLCSSATVNNMKGHILLPDGFVMPSDIPWTPVAQNDTTNVYTVEQWNQLQDAGAVFLPAAGRRVGSTVYNVGILCTGYYWTSSPEGNQAVCYSFTFSGAMNWLKNWRQNGCSVRLVQDL